MGLACSDDSDSAAFLPPILELERILTVMAPVRRNALRRRFPHTELYTIIAYVASSGTCGRICVCPLKNKPLRTQKDIPGTNTLFYKGPAT